jgi:biotin carboxylase
MPPENEQDQTQNTRPVILAGYSFLALFAFADVLPAGSLLFVEEPDIVGRRNLPEAISWSPLLRGVMTAETLRPGAADEFFLANPDLDPIAILPTTEYAVPFAARLAERYGLPGAGYGAASVLRDKEVLRTVSKAAGIANPRSVAVGSAAEAAAFMAEWGGPIVLKPANRQASLGTQIVRDPARVEAVWQECLVQEEGNNAPLHGLALRMLAEQFVEGEEFSVEMLVQHGRGVFANVTGKLLYPGPHPVEMGHIIPADIAPDLTELLAAQTQKVVEAAGFRDGMVHCEWIVSDGVPYIVECAGRPAGDGIIDMIRQAYPVDINRAFYDVLSGREISVELPAQAKGAAAIRFISAEPGVVTAIHGVEEAKASEGVFYADANTEVDERVNPIHSSQDRPGFAAALGATPAEALRFATEGAALIHVETRPLTEEELAGKPE